MYVKARLRWCHVRVLGEVPPGRLQDMKWGKSGEDGGKIEWKSPEVNRRERKRHF